MPFPGAIMVFNLFNLSTIIPSLCSHFTLSYSDVTDYFKTFDFVHETAFDFVDAFHINLLTNIVDCSIMCRHLTTSNDDLQSILENGLLTLDHVLTKDTPLNRFLSQYGISIYVKKHEMILHGNKLSISGRNDPCSPCVNNRPLGEIDSQYYCCDYHNQMFSLHNKLYHDKCEVEAYISGSDTFMLENYNSLTKGPEILFTIGRIIQSINPKVDPGFLQKAWSANKTTKLYILEFPVPLCEVETNTDYKGPNDFSECSEWFVYSGFKSSDYYEDKVPKEFFINKKLLEDSIRVLGHDFATFCVGKFPVDNGVCQILPKYHISPESLKIHFSSNLN